MAAGAVRYTSSKAMALLYGQDLAYIQSAAFGGLARAAAPEIVRLLKNATTPIHRVVDVGCGAGVLTSALVEAGFDVTGVDYSADRLAIAAARVPGARFVNASIYDYAIPGSEAIVAIGEPLTYMTRLQTRIDGSTTSFNDQPRPCLRAGSWSSM